MHIVHTKFDQILSIHSENTEEEQNSDFNQGWNEKKDKQCLLDTPAQ